MRERLLYDQPVGALSEGGVDAEWAVRIVSPEPVQHLSDRSTQPHAVCNLPVTGDTDAQ
jgi:hypothetical protein